MKMATSPGLTWSISVKPLLSASYSSFSKSIVSDFCEAIISSEKDILQHEDIHEPFYSSFVALASHFLSASAGEVSKSALSTVTNSCGVLLKFLLNRLQNPNESSTISPKYLMILMKGLCSGQSSLPKADVVTFTAMLKSSTHPPSIRDVDSETDELEPKEPKRTRLDLETNIFDHMTAVFDELQPTTPAKRELPTEQVTPDGDVTIIHVSDVCEEMKVAFGKRNLNHLIQQGGGNVLLDVCLNLPFLIRYIQRYQEAVSGSSFMMPSTLSEALTTRNSFQSLLNDISIVWRVFSMPVLEPLSVKRLDKIVLITMSCLYASVSVATANTVISLASATPTKSSTAMGKEEDMDNYATSIVQKSLEIYNNIIEVIHHSTRAGGNAAQNVDLLASWLLLRGLQGILTLTPSMVLERRDSKSRAQETQAKGREGQGNNRPTSGRSSYHGLGFLSIALARLALQLLNKLFDDLQMEGPVPVLQGMTGPAKPGMDVTILAPLSAWKKVQKLLSAISIPELIFTFVPTAFKKACLLRRMKQGAETPETSSSCASDSNTFYEDDFSSSEESSDDEDEGCDEPILGQWMEDVLSPADNKDNSPPPPLPPRLERENGSKRSRKISSSDSPSLIPDKKEPEGFVSIAANYLNYLNMYFISSADPELRNFFKQSLTEDHMSSLAQLIRDMDKECAKLASGVYPLSIDPWPMTVYPRTLAVLAEVLLLKQQRERESKQLKSQSEAAIINIWVRFLTTLKSNIQSPETKPELIEDVNVEHLQLLLFLFHSLPLKQKKTLLIQMAQNFIHVAQMDKQQMETTVPLSLCRLMLVFDYLLHYFYDPPANLVEQVQWNLFTVFTLGPSTEQDKGLNHCIFLGYPEVEDNFRKNLTPQDESEGGILKPRFYKLAQTEVSSQDAPKVDGLACSFLLASSECLDYNQLYDACIALLLAGLRCDKTQDKLSIMDSSVIEYNFLITWRLLACLPPSVQYLKSLETGDPSHLDDPHLLHTLRWAPRLGEKVFTSWIKDCLVKQGLTTQQAETLLCSVNSAVNNIQFDTKLANSFLRRQIRQIENLPMKYQDIISPAHLPGIASVLLLDALIAKVHVSLDDTFTKAMDEIDPHKTMDVAQDLIPASLRLVEAYTVYLRSCILSQLNVMDEEVITPRRLQAFSTVMSIASSSASKISFLGITVLKALPGPIKSTVEAWGTSTTNGFPTQGSWRSAFSADLIPVESYIDASLKTHIGTLSAHGLFTIQTSMKHLLKSLCKFVSDLVTWCPDTDCSKEMVRVMFPMLLDVSTEYLTETVSMSLEKFLGPSDGEDFLEKMYIHVLTVCHSLVVDFSDTESGLEEKILLDCLQFMESHIEKSAARKAFEKFYTETEDLNKILLSSAKENLSPQFASKTLKFFIKLLQLADKHPNEKGYSVLCKSLSKLADVDQAILKSWLSKMISVPKDAEEEVVKENRQLLQTFTMHLVKEKSPVDETVCHAILSALIPLGENLLSNSGESGGFPELMVVMDTLAGVGQGTSHTTLFRAATRWLQFCKDQIIKKDILEKVMQNSKSGKNLFDTLCCLLSYIGEILGALKKSREEPGNVTPRTDIELPGIQDADSDWTDELAHEDDDSGVEDSDEESLNNKLCTFTITQKEFMNQHWYHCHTCKMVDGVGVCTVCAKVCHKDHDLTYAKFGSFFCDCGAKEEGLCKALVKRTPQSGIDSNENLGTPSPFSMETVLPSSLRRRLSSPGHVMKSGDKTSEQVNKTRESLSQQVESYRSKLMAILESSETVQTILEMLESILPSFTENYHNLSPTGSNLRAKKALEELHTKPKQTEMTDQLMTVTLGSQEGAFENVRMNYSGDQGQQIRQLINAHMLRRVAMCVLASPQGKRQHLAVSHEKGKITILQLSALLKQADSSKKKLTLTRLASAPIPFTVLSITGNPCNEDFLAVCGLKDCHVLTFTSAGSVADHLVLHPTLATGNFIIKAIWLPGTQTELAIVTADFVKVYNLSLDAISPQYYFLLPSGKIRDATFVITEEGHYIVLMSSTGYIYAETMEDSSSAVHGPFYITNVLEVKHADLKDVNNQVAGGGVSVYYSHALQLLFFSYSQGKSFAAAVAKDLSKANTLFSVSFKSTNGGSKGGNSGQPLVQWSEVPGHTGLLYCMTQASNNPVVLMVRPDAILMQEIKVVPAKAKIQDVVAIRHAASNSDQQRTTMILLCEDGSLRIYMANVDSTNFWLSPYLQPQSPISVLRPVKKKKTTKSGRPTGTVSFPVDFFEHCQQSNDVEFGGNDILQVYNIQQVKHRLNTTGMYIASAKPAGFSIEISNTSPSTVMVGVRVLLGSPSLERSPSYLEVFGRSTRVSHNFGASGDPAGFTMVDSIRVYTKTKEAFGWPEESDEFQELSAAAPKVPPATGASAVVETTPVTPAPFPLSSADKLLGSALEVLDGAFATSLLEEKEPVRHKALELATSLLMLPTPATVQKHTHSLLASLYPSRAAYHNHKDQAQLSHVMECLSRDEQSLDVEAFQRLVVTARSIALARAPNLVRFAETGDQQKEVLEVTDVELEKKEDGSVEEVKSPDSSQGTLSMSLTDMTPRECCHFVTQLMETFWRLLVTRPPNPMLAPVCLPGLSHVDATVGAIVEIIHSFTLCDMENINLASKHYIKLLLSPDTTVSFACKQALIRCLRPRQRAKRVFIPSPPRCTSPGAGGEEEEEEEEDQNKEDKPDSTTVQSISISEQAEAEGEQDLEQYEIVENNEPIVIEPSESRRSHIPLEVLLGSGGNFPAMMDIPPDADDETMVELAIALSLQDQPGSGRLQGLRLREQAQNVVSFEECHLSDTTASAPGSDDEVGSNAATDGSTLRTSPAEHGGSAGSESAGSAEESGDHSASGRSSTYGDRDRDSGMTGARSETSSLGMPSSSLPHEGEVAEMTDGEQDTSARLHSLRLSLLDRLLGNIPKISNLGGVQAIPFMQVLLMLTSDLDSEDDKDRAALDTLLTTLLKELDLKGKDLDDVACRSKRYEVMLVYLRLVSVLLSRTKAGTKPSNKSSSFISNSTARALLSNDAIDYCLKILQKLLTYWKNYNPAEKETAPLPGQLLRSHPSTPPPDMSPFFLRQYVKGHASDIFEDYPQLLTEMVLRLPYQLKKLADSVTDVPAAQFDKAWHTTLAEYTMTQQTPFVKRQVRKLLLFICGSKEKYRSLRDLHAIESSLQAMMELCKKGGLDTSDVTPHGVVLPYDTLLTLIEHLKECSDIASQRPVNWQLYCQDHPGVLPYLVKASIVLDEGVAHTLLQLLQCALCGIKGGSSQEQGTSNSPAKDKKDKEKDKDKDKNEDSDDGTKHDETLCINLVQLLNKVLDHSLLTKFIRTFLLESNSTAIRWQAHSLIYQIYKNSSLSEVEALLELMWSLWQELPKYGRKTAQFVDLLGYFVLKTPQTSEKKTKEYLEKAVLVLREENQILASHPNAQIYNMLQGLVDFDGYYLESDPCLVCNNPEVPYTSLKLSAIKVDSKFTTTTQIVKLVGSHTISKITLRITDLKRTKMVRIMNIYYNNRTVQAVVELKNRPGLWHKARRVTLTAGQTDVKVEFPIPIVACNLMIEYAEFFDNLQATSETLQCPRCSASVPANPGVCGNCGENVFQCHKCRAINYDEKDPFLCNACGFCKYAKFDFTLTAKPCCAVDPIENEDDRKKAISTINALLEKADKIYRTLQNHRPALENLMIQVAEHSIEKREDGVVTGSGSSAPGSSVNKAIQQLALKYSGECKASFDELSKIIQKVLACRRELVDYDKQQREVVAASSSPITSPREHPFKAVEVIPCKKDRPESESVRPRKCFGCASATVQQCITLLRALTTNTNLRQIICSQGMIQELIDYNLRHGTLQVRSEVRSLLCLLTRDSRRVTEEMNNLIMTRIAAAVKGHLSNPDLGSSVRHEILLLANSLQQDDSCWELRVRCVVRLFLMGMQMTYPAIMDSITLPCLRILQQLVKTDSTTPPAAATAPADSNANKKSKVDENKPTDMNELPPLSSLSAELHLNCKQWLAGDPKYSYQSWKKLLPKHKQDSEQIKEEKEEGGKEEEKKEEGKKAVRSRYLMEKYGIRWHYKLWKTPAVKLKLTQTTWLQQAMFSASSRSARMTACSIIESIAQVPTRRKEVIDMLTRCLDLVGKSGECANEFLDLYRKLISPVQWKYYLAIKGVMLHLGDLIIKEVEHLQYLEETTLNSDLAQGFALKALVELLSTFVEEEKIKQHFKNKLVGYVLNGYLSLKKLLVQRTKLIDDTQDKLLELLEELTSGTESETREFMQVCVKTIQKYPKDDYVSPVFIFERLCSIIYPEENDIGEFFMILEKDPQQEDFLQGRMLGNPYSSNEPGLGPLMRDVKNKICQDCELVALLEDDTGMELLVNKKIISLDLEVKEVYRKIWAQDHGEGEPMQIIYRMRGLLGDATEDMVNSLESKSEEDVDKEEVFHMAAVLGEGDGLKAMLDRLVSIRDLVLGKPLMLVLLKLFSFTVNVKANRLELIKPELNTINVMLGALNLALWSEQESGSASGGTKGQTITEQVLQIMEVILMEASSQSPELYTKFSKHCGDKDQLMMLLERINSPFVRTNNNVLQGLMRLIPFLAFGEEDKMLTLINHFKPYMDFDKFDLEHTQDEKVHLDCFCSIAGAIESNANGILLKDMMVEHGIVKQAVDYIQTHSPEVKTLLATDSDNWKEFLGKPSLNYVLRLLTGICSGHNDTQTMIGASLIQILHKLEQVSSDRHIGTMAENLLEALRENENIKEKIEEVRQQTKAEKKRLAMAVRKKQLGALGMKTNEKGQVTVQSSVLKQMEELKDEIGLTCCICREGYRYQPQKVLAIYTYTKRVNLDEYENKQRKTVGYCTVSHFNVIHVDCHTAAVRHARGREEWESAALQNANTKCNGLLPLWGPQVQESAFATCLARHNTYLQECTGLRDPSYPFTIQDIKMLLWRFCEEKSFSDESGGGGRQSNMHLLPFMMHMALYVINTTRSVAREEKNLSTFLESPKEKWIETSFETEGVLYWCSMALHIMPPEKWKDHRLRFFEQILVMAHTRSVNPIGTKVVSDKAVKEYSVYKPYLLFLGLINTIYSKVLKKVTVDGDGGWSKALAEYIRNNDKPIIEAFDHVLNMYEEEMLLCESIAEFLDVIGLLEEVPEPDKFVTELLTSLP
ncbi:hypothetical protein ACJMK2_040271 [Sinanodonta woodiana]|uniref:UBR-type domain-containing protein n=1 Tax=Sinanodonta woodiana TaxID=1069815 RepID=A0ABD3WFP1_SINWO